jgi:hypothetical protein
MKTIFIRSSNRQPEAIRWKYPVRYNIQFPPGIYTPLNFPQTLVSVLNNTVPLSMPFDVQYNPITRRITISNIGTDFQMLFGESSMQKIAVLCGFTPASNTVNVYSQYIKGNTAAGSATTTIDDKLQFTFVSSFIANIPKGFYTYQELANKVQVAMNTVVSGQSYTCGYDEISNEFKIHAPISPGISLYWDTPESANLALLMGFRIINPPKIASLYNFLQMNSSNSHIPPQLPAQLSHFRYNLHSVVKATKISVHNLSLLSNDLSKMYNITDETNTILLTSISLNVISFKLTIPNGTYTPIEYCKIATQVIKNAVVFSYDINSQKITISNSTAFIGISFPNKKTAHMLGFNFETVQPTKNTIVSSMCVHFNYPEIIHFNIKYGLNSDFVLKTTIPIDYNANRNTYAYEFSLDTPFEATTIIIELTDEDNNYIPIYGDWTALLELQ